MAERRRASSAFLTAAVVAMTLAGCSAAPAHPAKPVAADESGSVVRQFINAVTGAPVDCVILTSHAAISCDWTGAADPATPAYDSQWGTQANFKSFTAHIGGREVACVGGGDGPYSSALDCDLVAATEVGEESKGTGRG